MAHVDTRLVTKPTQIVADLLVEKSTDFAKRRIEMKSSQIFGESIGYRLLSVILFPFVALLEGTFYTLKGLCQWTWTIISCDWTFSKGADSLFHAFRCFVGAFFSPVGIIFPELVIAHFVSDETLMQKPCQEALPLFDSWSPIRQEKAWHYAIENEERIDPAFFAELRKRDPGNSLWESLTLKLFYHRFSFEGEGKEGFDSSKSKTIIREICRSLNEWSTSEEIGEEDRTRIEEALPVLEGVLQVGMDLDHPEGSGEEIPFYDNSNKEKLALLMSTSYRKSDDNSLTGHLSAFLLSPSIWAKIDTGTGRRPGIKFYSVGNWKNAAAQEAAKRLTGVTRAIRATEQQDDWRKAKKDLSLKRIAYFPQSQTVGNCGWMASAVSLIAIFVFQELYRRGRAKSADFEAIQQAHDQVLDNYFEWSSWDRAESLTESYPILIKRHAENPKSVDLIHLHRQIFDRCLEKEDYWPIARMLILWRQRLTSGSSSIHSKEMQQEKEEYSKVRDKFQEHLESKGLVNRETLALAISD